MGGRAVADPVRIVRPVGATRAQSLAVPPKRTSAVRVLAHHGSPGRQMTPPALSDRDYRMPALHPGHSHPRARRSRAFVGDRDGIQKAIGGSGFRSRR